MSFKIIFTSEIYVKLNYIYIFFREARHHCRESVLWFTDDVT